MPTSEQIQSERKKLLAELAQLDQIRRGSLTEQMVEAIARDGQRRKRGPYPLYTYKERGRTVSRRVRTPVQVQTYREQIERGRRFHQVTAELLRLGEALSDQVMNAEAQKKTSKRKSKRSSKPIGSSRRSAPNKT
jgi:hypothetical protein